MAPTAKIALRVAVSAGPCLAQFEAPPAGPLPAWLAPILGGWRALDRIGTPQPIARHPEEAATRPSRRTTARASHPSRLAALAPQDDGLRELGRRGRTAVVEASNQWV